MFAHRTYDPGVIFVRGGAIGEAIEWAFWLGALIWWIDDLSLSPLELILMGVVLEATVLVSETPTGVVADLYSRKWSLIIAHTIMGIGFAWAIASRNFWLILPAQAVFGFGWTFQSGADVAWVTDELRGVDPKRAEDHHIEQLLLRRHRFGMLCGMVGVVAIMFLGVRSIRLAIVITAIAKLCLAGWYALRMEESHFVARRHSSTFRRTLTEGVSVIRRRPRLRILVVTLLITQLGSEALDRLGFIRFIDGLDVDEESIIATGILFLVLAAAGIAANAMVTHRLHGQANAHGGDATGVDVVPVAFALLAIASVGAVIVSLGTLPVVIGLGLMMEDATREALDPVVGGWTNRDVPTSVRATVHSLIGQTIAVGEILGGLILGTVAELAGVSTALMISASLLALGAAVARRARTAPDLEAGTP